MKTLLILVAAITVGAVVTGCGPEVSSSSVEKEWVRQDKPAENTEQQGEGNTVPSQPDR